MNFSINYGKNTIYYQVIRRVRKTLEITVKPGLSVVVTAPQGASDSQIQEKVRKRLSWIVKQQKWFRKLGVVTPPRQYLSGESHLYLGKKYRLKVIENHIQHGKTGVKLSGGYFQIYCKKNISVEKLLKQWYLERAKMVFAEILTELVQKYKIQKEPRFQIRKMSTQWGSLSQSNLMSLNPLLIQAPKDCIEYVITHELCHIEHLNHSPEFYRLLKKRMPDWEYRKQKLEEVTY